MQIDEENCTPWKEIRASVDSFDLIAFRGADVISNLISKLETKRLGKGTFTHVGLVVRSKDLPSYPLDPTKLYVFESTFSYTLPGMPSPGDVISGKGKFGVQLRDLDEVIPSYLSTPGTKIAWCPLKQRPSADIFETIFVTYDGRKYEMDLEGLLGALYPCCRPIRDARNVFFRCLIYLIHKLGCMKNSEGPAGWQFCSELVANVYRDLGVLPKDTDAENVVPMDFFGYDEDGIPIVIESVTMLKANE